MRIRVFKEQKKIRIAKSDSTVKAGFPSPAGDFSEGSIDLNEHLIKNSPATFIVQTEGDSMINAGILPGDYLIVDRSLQAGNNDIVIALIDNEFTVKRYKHDETGTLLVPENDNYAPLDLHQAGQVEIWGVVTGVVRKMK